MSGDVEDAITYLIVEKRWAAGQVHEHLMQEERYAGRVPSERTIRRMVEDLTPADPSGAWHLVPGVSGNAGAILDVIVHLASTSRGRTRTVTRAEADWITVITEGRPDIPVRELWLLTRFYMIRQANGLSTEALDSYLAFAPWRSGENLEEYMLAVELGWVDKSPVIMSFQDMENATFSEDEQRVIFERLVPVLASLASDFQSSSLEVGDNVVRFARSLVEQLDDRIPNVSALKDAIASRATSPQLETSEGQDDGT